ncbi:unnamed protein product [Cladocopium goreaui]|uniref:RING-type domain-containing protein n=1 Tax=Cladocopium goreaui TaxID=2562237 RepID=A0A9P1DIT5_9DINO|nr:unnamed protein product [Cladocopium goreaui]
MVEVPGGGANWAIFRTPDVRQEVTKVNLPCGRWCITVCAEDAEVARKLRPDQGVLSCAGETTMESHAASREVSCDCCSFAAGDGVLLTCPGSHRICRNCLFGRTGSWKHICYIHWYTVDGNVFFLVFFFLLFLAQWSCLEFLHRKDINFVRR